MNLLFKRNLPTMPLEVVPMSRKIAMAAQVMAGVNNAKSQSIRYNLSRRQVERYVNKLRNKGAMAESRGRPRIFDQTSMAVLNRYMSQTEQPTREEIMEQFIIEQKKSWCRLHHTSIDSITEEFGPKKLCSRSILRYLRKLNYKG